MARPLPDCMRRCALSCDWPRRLAGGHFLAGSGPANVFAVTGSNLRQDASGPCGCESQWTRSFVAD